MLYILLNLIEIYTLYYFHLSDSYVTYDDNFMLKLSPFHIGI